MVHRERLETLFLDKLLDCLIEFLLDVVLASLDPPLDFQRSRSGTWWSAGAPAWARAAHRAL